MISKHMFYFSGAGPEFIDIDKFYIKYKKLSDNAIPPQKTVGNVGIDFFTNINEEVTIYPGERVKLSTGICLEIPAGYAIILKDRSGFSTNEGMHVLAGVIDSSYRGEIIICLVNLGTKQVTIKPGQKIVQGIIIEDIPIQFEEVKVLSNTDRGTKGFGSTGK